MPEAYVHPDKCESVKAVRAMGDLCHPEHECDKSYGHDQGHQCACGANWRWRWWEREDVAEELQGKSNA